MSKPSKIPPGNRVRFREDISPLEHENAGQIGIVVEELPHLDPSKIYIQWPGGLAGWEDEGNFEIVGGEDSCQLGVTEDD